ncbi:MAG: S41 family peptidase [Saprospiraceae bacterium]
MKSIIKITTILLLAMVFTSCEKIFMESQPETTPMAIFEEAWTFADREYSFFEFKNIDWQAIHDEYAAKVNDEMGQQELFNVIADMLYELKDGHVNLSSSFDRSRNWTWFLNHAPNFDYDLLERSYFKEEEEFTGAFTTYDFGDVGYMRYSSFSSNVSASALDYILTKFKNHKGIIIDVRDNGGGSVSNVSAIAERFISSSVLIGRQDYKNGPNRDEFSDLSDIEVTPYDNGEEDIESIRFTKPVVLLTNRSCYSATTFFTQYMRSLPNVTTVGDWTGGGGGAPSFTELANGWIIRVSNTRLFAPDGFNVEGGIPPDVQVEMNDTDKANGLDSILEKGLEIIRG